MKIPNIDRLLALDSKTRAVSPEERELLQARLKEDDEEPDTAIPWTDARAELLREQ